ncbi:MAG TPA: hypothetical protein VFT99_12955, partial [Roseiflexaceae bacterium]|nr:hypothetical protein [Roseiflexaceae bacterium]
MSTQHEHAGHHTTEAPAEHVQPATEHDQHAGHQMDRNQHAGHDMAQADPSSQAMNHDAHAGHDMAAAEHAGHQMAHSGHDDHGGHAGHSPDMFRWPFWISLILTLPVVIYSPMIQMLLGYTAPAFPGSQYLGLALGSVIFWYGGWPFLSGAAGEIRNRAPGMMTLVALAITTAYAYSVAITLGLVGGMDFYWELATLVTIMLLGHWLEMRAVGSAQSALNELAKLLPDTAERITANGDTERVAVADLKTGDLVLVRPGSAVPADGSVEQGDSQVNESMITGESRPVGKHQGD